MPQSTETIEQLRARLAGMKKGPARIEPLGDLSQKLFQRMMTAPLESPGARADLDEAIECADEIYEYHQDGDPQRPQIAAFLGYMLTFRSFHVQDTSVRQRAKELLEEAIAYERFPVTYLAMLRVLLAMQLVTGSQSLMAGAVSLSPIDMMAGRRSPGAMPDIDRAEQLLRTVRETSGVSKDVFDMAEMLLQICELTKALLGLGTRPMDLSAMQGLFSRLTELQGRFNTGGSGIFGMMRNVLAPGAGMLDVRRDEIPVIIMEASPTQSTDTPPEKAPAAVPPPQPTQSDLLRSLVRMLALERDGRSAWETTARYLLPESDAPDVETVDNAIALAGEVVESDDPELSAEDIALAHFVYAVTLCLRQRTDPASDGSDCERGAHALLAAARALPAGHPEMPVVLRSLGAFLATDRPLANTLAAGFTGRFDALLATENLPADRSAELHALRCVCRAAFAAAELRTAVETLPADYPWPVSLKSAAQLLG